MASSQISLSVNGKDNTKSALNSVSNNIKHMASEVKSAASKIDLSSTWNKISTQAKTAVDKIKGFFSGLGGVITSLFSGVSLSSLVNAGVQSEQKWTNIAANVGLTLQQIGVYKTQIRDIANNWGVSNSELSAGVQVIAQKYGDITKAMSLSNGLAATSLRMGISAEEIANALFKAETGQTRALKGKVLTVEQYNRYLADGKLTEEEIGLIMKENELVAQGMTDTAATGLARMDNATSKLKTSLGLALLPAVELLASGVEKVANWFNDLNPTVKQFAAYLTAGALTLTALGAPLAIAGPIITGMAKGMASVAKSAASAVVAMWDYVVAAKAADKADDGVGQGGAGGGLGKTLNNMLIGAGAFTVVGVAIWSAIQQGYAHAAVDEQIFNPKRHENTIGQAMVDAVDSQKPKVQAALGRMYDTEAVKNKLNDLKNWLRVSVTDEAIVAGARGIWNGVAGAAQSAFSAIMGSWNSLKSAVGRGISTVISIGTGAIDWARQKYNELRSWIMSNPIVQRIVTIASSGASAVSNVVSTVSGAASSAWAWLTGARGPGDVKYMDYAGYTGRNPWQSDGTLAGNCVDMSVGLVQRYGGELVNGTWNGGLHTWWRAPDGREYDPSRKALNNTWAPPNSRGPGDGGVTYVFNAPVYGYDDFARKVEQVNNRIVSGVF